MLVLIVLPGLVCVVAEKKNPTLTMSPVNYMEIHFWLTPWKYFHVWKKHGLCKDLQTTGSLCVLKYAEKKRNSQLTTGQRIFAETVSDILSWLSEINSVNFTNT